MSVVEITYRVYYNNSTECTIFNNLKDAKKFIKMLNTDDWALNKYCFHHSYIPWQDMIEISHG